MPTKVNRPLQRRAGRNIGVESLSPFIQNAGSPEVPVTPVAFPGPGPATEILRADDQYGARTPFTRSPANGHCFNTEATDAGLGVWFEDGEGNDILIGASNPGIIPAGESAPLVLEEFSGSPGPFTPGKPLILCDNERLVARSILPAPPPPP